MSVTGAHVALASDPHERVAQARARRPLPTEVADIICVEESGPDVAPRIHARFAITVIRSAAVVRCESSRSLIAARNSVLLVPALQLSSLRVQGRPSGGTVTMLVGASHLSGLEATDRAALVTDTELVEQAEEVVSLLSRPEVPLESATTMRTLLGHLTSSAAPVGSMLPRQGTPLGAARGYLRAHMSEPVTIAELAGMMGLAESHLIRVFHHEFGLPPHAYHLRLRLAAACKLLESGLSVSTVAFECGFADQSHLSRNFKAVYGLTPAAWTAAIAGGGRRNAWATGVQSISRASRRDPRRSRALNS